MNVSTKLLVQISANTSQFVAGLNQANRSMGLMQKSLVSLKNTLVGTFGAYAVINGIQEAVKTLAEFDKVMTQVSVITGSGKLTNGFAQLELSALKLGSTTQYTAKEVANLQLEFGRLGFSTKEILNSTEATVNLATATGEGLARSAEIAGSTLRAFNLDASQMGRVTDVMAAALNNSALTLDSFADGIKYVSPVAASVNVSLEETAAMMSVLADAGIKGTQAGTSLRRIFTMLTDDGKPLQERLDALAKAGINLAAANDEVGLYAQTALLVITKYKPKIDQLTEAYNKAIGATKQMSAEMQDNLGTAITKVGTAWDSLILSFKNSTGFLKQDMTNLATFLNLWAIDSAKAFNLVFDLSDGAFDRAKDEIKKYYEVLEEGQKKQDDLITQKAKQAIHGFGTSDKEVERIRKAYATQKDGAEIYARVLQILLEEQKKEAEALVKKTADQVAANDALEESNKLYQEAIKLASQLGNEENNRMLSKAAMRDFNIARPDIASKQNQGIIGGGTNLEEFFGNMRNEQMDTLYEKLHKLRKEYQELNISQAQFLGMGVQEWAYFGNRVGDSIGRIIGKEEDLAVAMAKTSASILDSIQNIILANIARGSSALFAANPILGAAVIGIGFGVAKGLLNMIGRNKSTPNTGSTSVRGNSRMEVYGRFEMSGKTAVALVKSGSYSNAITG
jgi:hypothetical protein